MEIGLKPRTLGSGQVLFVKPPNLHEAIKLQAMQIVAGGGRIKPCDTCGELFVAGGEHGKRADAAYCKDACRDRANNEKKALAQKARKAKKKPHRR